MEYKDGTIYWTKGPNKGKECGWVDQHGYRITRMGRSLVRNHHIVWYMFNNSWPESEVDHINNNPSDNRIENLRLSNRQGQGANQKLQKRREGKFKGVHQIPEGNYYVKIKKEGKTKTGLGMFTCPKEAAMVYNMWAERFFGEFANYNTVFTDVTDLSLGD